MQLIGPHEGHEFELLDKGEKNIAYFYELIPNQYYDYRDDPAFGVIEYQKCIEDISIPYVILYRLGFKADAEELKHLTETIKRFDADVERRIGQLLGYPKAAIDYYVLTRCEGQLNYEAKLKRTQNQN